MARIGFDLGTTNSAVCVWDPDSGSFDYLKFDGCAREFFPTLIAYSKEDPSRIYVGEAARRYRFSPRFDVYDTFKLSMGEGAYVPGDREKAPFQAAQDFVSQVLKKLSENQGIGLEDVVLVQTVPDIWKNEIHNKIALENLAQMYDGISLDVVRQVSFESEPVSAAVYYLNEVCRGEYHGYIVVVDYGGGTLDLTLCRVERNGTISVLFSCGDGGKGKLGCAGAAFDRAVTTGLVKKYGLEEMGYAPESPAFRVLQSAFEDCKIASTQSTREALTAYYESGGFLDPVAFSVVLPPPSFEEYDVHASDISGAFEEVNQRALRSAVLDMQKKCRELDVDMDSTEHFRVLLVGGFSNLYCVENCVREQFSSLTGVEDPRFDPRMNRASRSTAIAHGACLIAADITPVVYINQTELGFYARNLQGKEVAVPVLERGRPVKDYAQAKFSPYSFLRAFQGLPVSLTLYFDDGAGPVRIPMDELFHTLCPNYDQEGNRYKIGFSIDRNRIPQLHIQDASGAENVVSLYKTITRLPAVIIREEDAQEVQQ